MVFDVCTEFEGHGAMVHVQPLFELGFHLALKNERGGVPDGYLLYTGLEQTFSWRGRIPLALVDFSGLNDAAPLHAVAK